MVSSVCLDGTGVRNRGGRQWNDGNGGGRVLLAFVTGAFALFLSAPGSAGTTFGIYDARTLAMGGASVASADTSNAQFYNAALLAFNDKIEEETRDSRFLLPLITPQVSQSVLDAEDIVSDDLGRDLSRAVNAFNAAPESLTAQNVVDASRLLDRAVAGIENDELFGDVYVGLAVTEPGQFQGAAFFVGARLLGGGTTDVTAEDLALLDDYQEGLLFVATNGAQGSAQPQLFDANGDLLDPVDSITSSASATGVAITELGVSLARQFDLFGSQVAGGISMKMLDVRTFQDVERLIDDRIDVDNDEESEVSFNMDLGLARDVGEHWRVGLAVKDVIPYSYRTESGASVRLRPRPRIGAAYQYRTFQFAADFDVIPNRSLGEEPETQEAALGGEWAPTDALRLRAGFRADLNGSRESVASIGAGFIWRRIAMDFAYAEGADLRAAALQFGWVF